MARATWNGITLAESDGFQVVEGNIYFPAESVRLEYFRDSETNYECPRKGRANYYDIVVGGKVNKDAAWYYPNTKQIAKNIEGYIAFDRNLGVMIEE